MISEYSKVSANCQFEAVEAREEFDYLFSDANKRSISLVESVFRDGRTYKEAGKKIRRSGDRVRQIVVRAIRRGLGKDCNLHLQVWELSQINEPWNGSYKKAGTYTTPGKLIYDVYESRVRWPRQVLVYRKHGEKVVRL